MDRQVEKQLVKQRTNLLEVVREVVGDLEERASDDYWACCPFHQEDTPSFHVRPSRGFFKCFGCGEKGDVFSFVMKTRGLPFREALEMLADRCGVTLGSLTPEEQRRVSEARRTRAVLDQARDLFAKALVGVSNNPALAYLHERGFQDQVLESFDIGFIPTDFQVRLRRAGADLRQVEGAGFTSRFAGRVAFGIRDAHGGLVGFGARRLDSGDSDAAKYVNTRETPAFQKRRLLYGLDKASRTLARTGRLVVMEGYTDVIMAHQCGLTECVASMGTSFTEEQLDLVAGRVSNLVFVYDGDESGQRGAEAAVRKALDRGLECRVLTLPDGQDPCDWFTAGHDHEDFDRQLGAAGVSTVAFLCRRGLAVLDAGEPGGRERVAREVLASTATIRDLVRREAISAEVARECGVDRNLLRRSSGAEDGSARRQAAPSGRNRPVTAHVRCQFGVLAGLLEEPSRRDEVLDLAARGVLEHSAALRLLELLPATGADPVDWLERVGDEEPTLVTTLERLIVPPPGTILPSYDEAFAHLTESHAAARARAARREQLSDPDIALDEDKLRALQESLLSMRPGARAATPSQPDHAFPPIAEDHS